MSDSSRCHRMRQGTRRWLTAVVVAAVAIPLLRLGLMELCPRYQVLCQQGVRLPATVWGLQCWRSPWYAFADRSAAAVFQIPPADVPALIGKLRVNERHPATVSRGDPLGSSLAYFPPAPTCFAFSPTGEPHFRVTWRGEATPVEVLSCSSDHGDWLHVEVWSVPGSGLIKLYTDRN